MKVGTTLDLEDKSSTLVEAVCRSLVRLDTEQPTNGSMSSQGTRAVGQMQFININAGAPGTGTNGGPLFVKFGLTQDTNEILPYKTTTYDALQSELKGRFGSSIVGTVYTWSKASISLITRTENHYVGSSSTGSLASSEGEWDHSVSATHRRGANASRRI